MTEYHEPTSCNKCGGANVVDWVNTLDGHLCEAQTECLDCSFVDYWAYGFFESGSEIKSNCRKYIK